MYLILHLSYPLSIIVHGFDIDSHRRCSCPSSPLATPCRITSPCTTQGVSTTASSCRIHLFRPGPPASSPRIPRVNSHPPIPPTPKAAAPPTRSRRWLRDCSVHIPSYPPLCVCMRAITSILRLCTTLPFGPTLSPSSTSDPNGRCTVAPILALPSCFPSSLPLLVSSG